MASPSFFKSSLQWLHYLICMVVAFLTITSMGNFQVFVSKQTLSHWNKDSSVLSRFLWDILLLVGFMCQHSLMATPKFKAVLGSYIGVTVSQRLLYNTASSLALLLCIIKWESIPEAGLWVVDMTDRSLLWLLFFLIHAVAWLLWSLQVLLMDPGEMLGVSQVHSYYNGQAQPLTSTNKTSQKLLDLYSRLRHPGTLLVTLMLWLHPLMTLDRLLLACWCSAYLAGRGTLTEAHYTFAERHFKTVALSSKKKMTGSSVSYEYVED